MNKTELLLKKLRQRTNPDKAKLYARFFKTGKGEYGAGDKFLGLTVPQQREIAKGFFDLSLEDISQLLKSEYHEHRFTALVILCKQYEKGDEKAKSKIAKFYLKNARRINNWDLVDSSAPRILGDYFFDKDKAPLYKFAKSKNLWERRISILTTLNFIVHKKYADTLKIAEILLNDKHDLIHKAIGWMLREIWKRDAGVAEAFLNKHKTHFPRTALRYAIERMPETKRRGYLNIDGKNQQ